MDTSLDSLDARFKPLAMELLARLTERRVCVCIVNTRRTEAEQEAAIARHVSWVAHSLHQDGLAMDVCPYAIWALHGDDKLQWDATDPIWQTIGTTGEKLGLRWGGRWHPPDLGHFELMQPSSTGAVV